MSDYLQSHELQQARPPCPSPTPGVYSNPCPSNWWCHPTISSSVVPFSSFPQSLPASGSFPLSQLLAWSGQSISDSASVLPMNTQDQSPLGCTGCFLYSPILTSIHDHWKNHSLTRWTFVGKIMSLLFSMLSRLVITFFSRSKHLLISWLQSPSAVILEPPQNKVWHCFHCFPIYFSWGDGTRCHDLRFLNIKL